MTHPIFKVELVVFNEEKRPIRGRIVHSTLDYLIRVQEHLSSQGRQSKPKNGGFAVKTYHTNIKKTA